MAELIAPTTAATGSPVALEIAAGKTAIVGLLCADFGALSAVGAHHDKVEVTIVGAPATQTPLDLELTRGQLTRVIPNPTDVTITVQFIKRVTSVALGVFQIGGTPA